MFFENLVFEYFDWKKKQRVEIVGDILYFCKIQNAQFFFD